MMINNYTQRLNPQVAEIDRNEHLSVTITVFKEFFDAASRNVVPKAFICSLGIQHHTVQPAALMTGY